MTTQEQQLLISILNLQKKIKVNDTTVIDDVAVINSQTLTIDQEMQVSEIVRMECEKLDPLNKDLLKTVINSFSFVDQAYLNELIEFELLDNADHEAYKTYINAVIAKPIKFNNPRNEYFFFSRIVNACIPLRDAELVSKTIDKIQSIRTV